jgi:F-type H+-transporting ATPase subunit b
VTRPASGVSRRWRRLVLPWLACVALASGSAAAAEPPSHPGGNVARSVDHGETTSEHGEHDEKAPPPPINWTHGLLGEKAGVPPSLLWRAPGEPPPFLASLLNFALLVGLMVRFGKKPVADALTKRKNGIVRDIEESQRMRAAAEKRLQEYEDRLSRMNEELERVRREFREQGERDKERIVREATERRDRMLDDARLLLAQEAKDLRQVIVAEVVEQATRRAAEILSTQMTLGDHDRFAEAVLADVRGRAPARTAGSFGPPRGGAS